VWKRQAAVSDREILSSRVFDAPRGRLFGLFTNAGNLKQWWGPRGFTNTFHEFDLRKGGRWRFTMRGPDEKDYHIEKEFLEVLPPERIVLKHCQEKHSFEMTMTYEEAGSGTRLTWRMIFDSPIEDPDTLKFIQNANEENFDRLQALIESDH
jgi:uncharacterized protein YndB with AHSA1/START domain